MTELNQDPFDARWLNCLYGGKLAGRAKVVTDVFIFIEPLLEITLQDGSKTRKFFGLKRNCKTASIAKDDFVIFEWQRVGERSYDRKRDGEGDPEAIEIEVTSKEVAEELTKKFKGLLPSELREIWIKHLKRIVDRENSLDSLIEEEATNRTKNIKTEYDRKFQELSKSEEYIYEEMGRIDQSLQKSEQRELKIKELFKEIEPYRLAVPVKIENLSVSEALPLPEKVGTKWHSQLQTGDFCVSRNIANSFLLSMLSGFYSGGIVLLNGSVGVGKTSIVKHSAKLIGGSCAIIPVRPAWIEPADLLGFFDPIHEIFRPTSFLTALKNAETDRERLNLICLDELNLAKIENYASDLLSKLEYSREIRESDDLDGAGDANSLLLFSGDIETELWQVVKYLEEQQSLESNQKARQQRLQMFLQKWRSHQPVPQNMILLGTLNSDETTYDLSPKVIDRSYTITYPIADFNQLPKQVTNQVANQINSISSSKLRQVLHDGYKKNWDLVVNGKSQDWVKIQQWQSSYFAGVAELGTPLGYRTMKDYAVFCAIADWLELNPKEAFGHFLFTKILPRIKFFKDNQTNGLFQEWLKELKQNYKTYDPANILDRLERQLNDERRQIVRYWG
ncbi:AAA domain-containing protein [Pseudanabaena sp. UWO311]|uniref:AAA family ATPase n=1 Tax=Pseudanabaena sp. UWO311 TaxID=2487337 RepID=UPI001157BBA0|nr:AAA family ATPase [Pseudanabaena sp. UWO311]TYQ28243.1 AAA domain-containing protein [Pseudanabaena sp. UWO311]